MTGDYAAALRVKAIALIHEAYEMAARMEHVDLDSVNAPRPKEMRYRSRTELARDFEQRANAMVQFASELGLITTEDALTIARTAT